MPENIVQTVAGRPDEIQILRIQNIGNTLVNEFPGQHAGLTIFFQNVHDLFPGNRPEKRGLMEIAAEGAVVDMRADDMRGQQFQCVKVCFVVGIGHAEMT